LRRGSTTAHIAARNARNGLSQRSQRTQRARRARARNPMKNATAGKAVASVVFWFLNYLNLKLINTHEAPNSCVLPHSIFHPLHKAYGHPQ
jgi:hypothetical protein